MKQFALSALVSFFPLYSAITVTAQTVDIQSVIDSIQKHELAEAEEILRQSQDTLTASEQKQLQAFITQHSPQGDWIPLLRLIADKAESNPDFLFLLSQALWRTGDESGALKVSGEAMAAAKNDLQLQYKCAAIARTLGRLDIAKQRIEKILALNASHSDTLFLQGSIWAEEGENEKAKNTLLQVIQSNPKHFRSLFELGKLETRLGNDEQAVQYLSEAINAYPFFREAYAALRTPLSRLDRKNEFSRLQETIQTMRAWNPDQYRQLRYMYENAFTIPIQQRVLLTQELLSIRQFEKAMQYLINLNKRDLLNDPLRIALAQLHYQQKEFPDCLSILGEISDTTITQTERFVGIKGWSLLGTGDAESSLDLYNQYKETFPDSPNFAALGVALSKIDKKEYTGQSTSNIQVRKAFQFRDASKECGLDAFQHRMGHNDKRWIIDAMGSGVAVGDYDNDGDDDVYFVNGRPDLNENDGQWRNGLFRNDGGRFVDVTERAHVGDAGWGMCAVFGDVNNDGWLDLFVGNFGADVLYINNGDGSFTERTQDAGLSHNGYAAAAVFGDVDLDGDLDLFVGNYVEFTPIQHGDLRDKYHGMDVMRGPMGLNYQNDLLYFNKGDGTFEERSQQSQINISEGRAMGASMADFDLDGDLDLYVANDSTYNHVLLNDGKGQYEDSSFVSGAAVNESGREGASMGVATGDYNNDGRIDIFVTAYEQEPDTLFQNKKGVLFTDVTGPSKLTSPSHWLTTWGTGFCDFDSDGFLDIYTVNGHTYPQVEQLENDRSYTQGVSLYQNIDAEHFRTETLEFDAARTIAGRGSALLDYDNDGDMDIVINCIDDSPRLLKNQSSQGNWLKVKLNGTSAQTFGVRVVIEHKGQQWTRTVDGGSSYLSQNSQTLHFGLGEIDQVEKITIHWLARPPQTYSDVSTNQTLIVTTRY